MRSDGRWGWLRSQGLGVLCGQATVLLLADLLARTVAAPQEIPVGIITALAGTPFFLWVLRHGQSGGE